MSHTTLKTIEQIKEVGGYTHNLTHTTGYMVSTVGNEAVIPASVCSNKDWSNYYTTHRPVKDEHYVGVWYNPDDDNFYFDVSQWVEDKQEALALGERNNQLAVYEIETGECIPVELCS